MSGLFWSSTSAFDESVDKATSEHLPTGEEDIALNLEICDQVRSKGIAPKDAMRSLKRRLNHKNPNVQLLALSLTDICVKNGGDHFLVEVASREFMDNLVSILKIPLLNNDVKEKILRLVQNWSTSFQGRDSLKYVNEVYKSLGREGFKFPPQDFSAAHSAMVDTQTAPEWIDSDICLRCRTPFTFTNRKHHCRNCGQVFDQACSSKSLPLPHFGIAQEVRVCDSCHVKLTKFKNNKPERRESKDLYPTHKHSRSGNSRPKSSRELADEELQRAIALSLEESNQQQQHGPLRNGHTPWSNSAPSEPPVIDSARSHTGQKEDDDPELRAAIEASLREANAPRPSAPDNVEQVSMESHYTAAPPTVPALPNYDLQLVETDAILTFSQSVNDPQAPGEFMRNPEISQLYDRANSVRPRLAQSLEDTRRKEELLAEMNDKLSQAVKLYDHLLTEQLARPRRAYNLPQQTPYHQSMHAPTTAGSPAPTQQAYAPQMQAPIRSPQSTLAQPIQQYYAVAPTASPVQNLPSSPAIYHPEPQSVQSQQTPLSQSAYVASQQHVALLPQHQEQTVSPALASYPAYPLSTTAIVQSPNPGIMSSPQPGYQQSPQAIQDPVTHQQSMISPSQSYVAQPLPFASPVPPAPSTAQPPNSQSTSSSLPMFPAVPTSPLSTYSSYPPSIEQEGRKEAMLISFD